MREFFENGYGISVIETYAKGDSLEIAVLKGDSYDWRICYDTKITDNVIGGLSEDEVNKIATQIANL